jgi:cellobiose-specific phosphotransferase system component IIB
MDNRPSKSQKEALINEYKGYLFEYLTGEELSSNYAIDQMFYKNIPQDLRKTLSQYEAWLRVNDIECLESLPMLAENVSKKVQEIFKDKMTDIFLVGKTAAKLSVQNESDLVLVGEQKKYYLSLKLCKYNSFVNTKSGGVSSFINKYLHEFQNAIFMQDQFNELIKSSFSQMGQEMHELAGLEWRGRFDEQWGAVGLPDLPGQLDEKYSVILSRHYHRMCTFLYDVFSTYLEQDFAKFQTCVLRLMGMSTSEIIQVICFHEKDKHSHYQLKKINISTFREVQKCVSKIELMPLKSQISSFNLLLNEKILQIRVKPMNKFTVSAYKLNCAIKYMR